MPKHRCPCCGWKIRLANEQPDVLAACSNCSQVVRVPGIPSDVIPKCSTDSMIDWGVKGNPQAHESVPSVPVEVGIQSPDSLAACPSCSQIVQTPSIPSDAIAQCSTDSRIDWGKERNSSKHDGVPLLPVELCIPRRKESSVWAYVAVGLNCIGISIFFAVVSLGVMQSQGEQIFFLGVGSLFLLTGVYLLFQGLHRLLRRSRLHLLSTAQLPQEAKHLGIPFALHRNQSVAPPVVLFFIGVLLIAGAVGGVILLLLGEIGDTRMIMVAICGVALGVTVIVSAQSFRHLWLLVYADGFVVLRDGEAGVLWRWEDITTIRLQKISNVPLLFAYTLHRKNGQKFAFDHRLEYIENQFGARVQWELCRLMLPQLLHRLAAGELVGFGPLQVSREGLHHVEGFVPWQQVANITLDAEKLTIRKWGADYGADWWVPYTAMPNLAVFFALVQLILRECSNHNENALSVLMASYGLRDSTAIQANTTNLQPPSQLTGSQAGQLLE